MMGGMCTFGGVGGGGGSRFVCRFSEQLSHTGGIGIDVMVMIVVV